MQKETFERAIHAWPEWHDSIERSRVALGYDANWPAEDAIHWIEENYPAIRSLADKELRRLELPPSLQEYWEDCLYSNYMRPDGKTDYDAITRRLSRRKSLPELPCDHGLVWRDGEKVDDHWLTVEIRLHARFATRDLLNYAVGFAYDVVHSHLEDFTVLPHPVSQLLRKAGRPPASEDTARECARLKDEEGWTYRQIGLHYGWALQEDSHGGLTMCSTAQRYVRRGRALRDQDQS
jgi:hypothetical protein